MPPSPARLPPARTRAAAMLLALVLPQWLAVGAESSWFARTWQSEDGLPDNNVSGIVQIPDGRLVVATHAGLERFDGSRFQKVPLPAGPGLSRGLIRSLVLDGEANLWLALDGAIVVRLGSEGPRVFTATNGLPNERPLCITPDGSGAIWIGYSEGSACRIQEGQIMRFTARHGLQGTGPCWLAADTRGGLWFAKAGRVGMFRDSQFVPRFTAAERTIRLGASARGGVWIAAGARVLRLEENGGAVPVCELSPEHSTAEPRVLLEDRSGRLWIGTTAGLFCRQDNQVHRVETSHGEILGLTEDREGSLWVGTAGGGLNRVRPRVIEFHGPESDPALESMRSICQDAAGTLWVATASALLSHPPVGGWSNISARADWPGGQPACVTADQEGGVWVGTLRGGLHRWHNGRYHTLRRSDGLSGDNIRSLLVSTNGDLWIATEFTSGLQRWRMGELRSFPLPSGSRALRAMAEDNAGRIWLGSAEGSLYRVNGDALADETPPEPAEPLPIRCLHAGSDGSLWIGYAGAGVGWLKQGRFVRLGTAAGLADDFVSQLAEDGLGGLWLAGRHGLSRVRQDDLAAFLERRLSRLRPVLYGRDEGVPVLQANYGYAPGAARSRDGRLWFPMRTGLAIVQADRARPNEVLPAVIIEQFSIDGQPALPDGLRPLRLPPGHRKLEFAYTAPSFVAPEQVQFRHRLEGLDDDWVEAGTQRTVSYARLPAGNYAFRVIACNSSGLWNETGAVLNFSVRPFVRQTWWFRGALLGFLAAGAAGGARYLFLRRLRRKMQWLEQQAALHSERARIAKDIHDDLGASLTQISLLGELVNQDLAAPDKAAAHSRQISATARQVIKTLDEIVWAVNPRNDSLTHLLEYIGQFAVDFLQAAGVRCRIDFPDQTPAHRLTAEVRHNLFLAVKEALHNIVKHARATEVWLRASFTERGLCLMVEDNGAGFERPAQDPWADGLGNIRQRLAEIGGVAAIQSLPGAGTKVRLELPWPTP